MAKNTFLVEVTFMFTSLNEKSIYRFHILSEDFFSLFKIMPISNSLFSQCVIIYAYMEKLMCKSII